jgi:hypothetical protein
MQPPSSRITIPKHIKTYIISSSSDISLIIMKLPAIILLAFAMLCIGKLPGKERINRMRIPIFCNKQW